MSFVIVSLTLFAVLTIKDADAETDAEQLAKKFSPILVLTEDTGGKWGDIGVLKVHRVLKSLYKPIPTDIRFSSTASKCLSTPIHYSHRRIVAC